MAILFAGDKPVTRSNLPIAEEGFDSQQLPFRGVFFV